MPTRTLAAAINSGTLPALEQLCQLSLEDNHLPAPQRRGRRPVQEVLSKLRATVQEAARSESLSELNAASVGTLLAASENH